MTASPTASRRPTPAGRTSGLLLVGAAIVLEGLVTARAGFPSYAFATAVLMVLGGWTIAGCGLVAWQLAPSSRIGAWLTLAGAAFFAPALGALALGPTTLSADRLAWLSLASSGVRS